MTLKKEIEEKEKELKELKSKLQFEEEEKIRKEKGSEYFDKNFKLPYISDDYDFYPEENYASIKDIFISEFGLDNELDSSNIKRLREEYVQKLSSDVAELSNQVKEIEKKFEEIKEE